jgi:peroxiredoxin
LRKGIDKFEELDTVLYPITADKLENAQKLEQKYAREKYPIFYDEDKKVVKMLHQEVRIIKLGRMPGLLIIDKNGVIQFAYYGENMHDIPKNEVLFEVLEKLRN